MTDHQLDCNKNQCQCVSAIASQSLDELEFERGIWTAALYNDIDRLKILIKRGDTNRPDNFGYTALHYATRKNNFYVCELLLKSGADVNAITNSGTTPLHRAAMMGHNKIVQLLLANQATSDIKDIDGNTALHRAAQNGHYEAASILLHSNAKLKDCVNNSEQTPYDLAGSQCTELQSLLCSVSSN